MLDLKTVALTSIISFGIGVPAAFAQTAPDLVMFANSGESSSSLILQEIGQNTEAEVTAEHTMKFTDNTALDPESVDSRLLVESSGEATAEYQLERPESLDL